jgi:hypothetical protein
MNFPHAIDIRIVWTTPLTPRPTAILTRRDDLSANNLGIDP